MSRKTGAMISSLIALAVLAGSALAGQPRPVKDYVWLTSPASTSNPAATSQPTAELKQKLELHVRQLIQAGHMAPTRFYFGLGSGNATDHTWFFWKPYEVIEALSYAYPHLSPELQTQARQYMQAEMQKFPPWSVGAMPGGEGVRREYFNLPTSMQNQSFNEKPGLEVCYAMWLYGSRTGDWDTVKKVYPELRKIFGLAGSKPVQRYSQIGGLIGFARIAKQLGEAGDVSAAEGKAVEALEKGKDFGSFFLINGKPYKVRIENHNMAFHIFNGLGPEVGAFLRDYANEAVESYLKEITEIRPRANEGGCDLWYLTLGERSINSTDTENYCLPPDMGVAVFRALAFIRQVKGDQLAKWVDIPFCKGDLFYVMRASWALDAN